MFMKITQLTLAATKSKFTVIIRALTIKIYHKIRGGDLIFTEQFF